MNYATHRKLKHKKKDDNSYTYLHLEAAKKQGYIPYFGPCKPVADAEEIRNAVDDILANKRDKYALVKIGSQIEIWIIPSFYRPGYVLNTGLAPFSVPVRVPKYNVSNKTNSERPTSLASTENPIFDGPRSTREVLAEEFPEDAVKENQPDEGAVAAEVFEGEGGAVSSADSIERIQLVREVQQNDPLEQV